MSLDMAGPIQECWGGEFAARRSIIILRAADLAPTQVKEIKK